MLLEMIEKFFSGKRSRIGRLSGARAGLAVAMLPPDFVRHWEGKGLQRPYCFECIHFAHEMFTARGVCWEYGAYVSLYSSCGAFERRMNSSTPIVDEDQIRVSHRAGLKDLLT